MNYLEELALLIAEECGDTYSNNEWLQSTMDAQLWLGYAALANSRGIVVTSRDVHDVWAAWATIYNPTHPSIVPWHQLPPEVQAKDDMYRDAIRLIATRTRQHTGAVAIPREQGVNPGWRKDGKI